MRYVVHVPQLITGGTRPFFFTMKWAAETFARETGGTMYEATTEKDAV